jgi:general secretion pathway protein M
MITNIKDKQRQRWLAVGLLLLVIGAFAALIFIPLFDKSMALSEEKDALEFKLEQYERILATKNTVMASVENLKAQHDQQGYFINQETDALASAEMQEFIKKTIVDAGGQLSSTQVIPATTNKLDFSSINVRVRMTANSEVLRTVLHKIETSTPFIVIDQIDMRPLRGSRNPVTRQLELSNALSVNFQAVSFMRKKPE